MLCVQKTLLAQCNLCSTHLYVMQYVIILCIHLVYFIWVVYGIRTLPCSIPFSNKAQQRAAYYSVISPLLATNASVPNLL